MKLQGIIPPVVTPFLADESLDLPRLREHIDHMLARGVHGIFVLGTTGEFYALDEAREATGRRRRRRALPRAVAGVRRHRGRDHPRGRSAHQDGREAKAPTACPSSPRTSSSRRRPELLDHFRRVAESTSLPVVLYNNPATCGGVSIEPDTVARLAEVPNIVGIKDSSGDLQNTIELIKVTPQDKFAVLNGRDTLILAALLFGAKGAIPATCNIAPELCVGIYESFVKGDVEAARRSRTGSPRCGCR